MVLERDSQSIHMLKTLINSMHFIGLYKKKNLLEKCLCDNLYCKLCEIERQVRR